MGARKTTGAPAGPVMTPAGRSDDRAESGSLVSSAVNRTSSRLAVTAAAYDAVADLYANLFRGELDRLPLDQAMLAAFAQYVRAAGGGLVAELGCGPGQTTGRLRDLGLDAFGIDVSPVMIELARREYPGLRFEVGSMDALDLADGALAGIVSWYSIIHAAPEDVPGYFAEFSRTLAPGGHVLVAFFESEGGPVTEFDHKVTPAFRWPIDDLAARARQARFAEVGRMLREPREQERFRRGHLLLRRE